MRTRKPPCPVEKVWVDKHRYDEAERLHYEREAALAAAVPEERLELEAVNGVCQDDCAESDLRGDPKKGKNGKKQRKRKRSPKPKNVVSMVDSVLSGLLADGVWFEKPFYDRAENLYREKIVDCQRQEAPETELAASVPAAKAARDASKPRMLPAACSHGSLSACHHILRGVWVNKLDFDKAEKAFVERSQLSVPPNVLAIPSACSEAANAGLGTPDEGYATAVPTPATPGVNCSSLVSSSPGSAAEEEQTVNGKPQVSSLQALVAEVWLEKPLYDGAEKNFYENMFDAGQEQQRRSPVALRGHREVGESPGAGDKPLEAASSGAEGPPPPFFFLHADSEPVWLNKLAYERAESRFRVAEALQMSRAAEGGGENVEKPQLAVVKSSQPPAGSMPVVEKKKMAVQYLASEKIWFEKFKYDDAERRYYEQMNGPAGARSCPQENGASTILRDIARARENIQKSLAGSASTSSSGPGDQNELLSRISHLEVENQNLRSVVADLQMAIFKLESRLNALEKSTSHQPSPVPPTQKVEPFSVPSKKVELPSASPAKKAEPAAAEEDDDDDIDLFGSDDEEEDQEAAKVREERLRQYAEKKAKKPGLIAKSSILLDVKPWDDETDMAKLEECVRSVQMDGLVWGASKLVPVGYGIKKLQIQCVVEDDKVGTDILEEEITKFEDYVQSVDIAAFNKI
ncbi:EF1D factor, partial [Alectura lathami]|nr:EF1D factor [Alectura lathami]